MEALESLKLQLEQMRSIRLSLKDQGPECRFHGSEDLILQFGRVYKPAPLPAGATKWTYPKSCFQNSYKTVTTKRGWIYVEGFALNPNLGLSTHHAWLTRADTPGIAFDPTWEDAVDQGTVYMGIPFDRAYVVKMHRLSRWSLYSVIDAYWARWPLLIGTDRIEDVMANGVKRVNGKKGSI